MRKLLVLAALALGACATQAGFDARMQSLVGQRVGDVVQAIGVPDGDFTAPDGRRFLQYERLGIAPPTAVPMVGLGVGGFGWRGGYGTGWGFGAGYPAYAYTPMPACRVTLEVQGDRVVSFSRAGSGCIAVPPEG